MIRKISILIGRLITVYLIVAMLVIASIPTQSAAMFISSDSVGVSTTSIVAEAMPDMDKVKTFLESKIIRQRLSEFGLSSDEIASRLNQLSADELHQIASHIDQVDAGGDSALGLIISLLVIVILFILVMRLMGHHVIVK